MAATAIIAITDAHMNAAGLSDLLAKDASAHRGAVIALVNYLEGLASGARNGKMSLRIEDVITGSRAFGTITLTFANITANDTITLGGIPLTWKAAAASEDEVTIGADLAAAVANLAAAINAHSLLKTVLTAAVTAVGVVTVTYLVPGLAGSLFTWSTSDATMAAFSPATRLGNVTGAVQAVSRTYGLGMA